MEPVVSSVRELHGEDVAAVEFPAPFGTGRRRYAIAEDADILERLLAYVRAHEDRFLGAITIGHLDDDGDGAIDTARWVAYFHVTESKEE